MEKMFQRDWSPLMMWEWTGFLTIDWLLLSFILKLQGFTGLYASMCDRMELKNVFYGKTDPWGDTGGTVVAPSFCPWQHFLIILFLCAMFVPAIIFKNALVSLCLALPYLLWSICGFYLPQPNVAASSCHGGRSCQPIAGRILGAFGYYSQLEFCALLRNGRNVGKCGHVASVLGVCQRGYYCRGSQKVLWVFCPSFPEYAIRW